MELKNGLGHLSYSTLVHLADGTAVRLRPLGRADAKLLRRLFCRLSPTTYYAHGYSGQGVVLSGMFGKMMAMAVMGDAGRFDLFSRIKHYPFPGGPLRRPAHAMGMLYYRIRDLLA